MQIEELPALSLSSLPPTKIAPIANASVRITAACFWLSANISHLVCVCVCVFFSPFTPTHFPSKTTCWSATCWSHLWLRAFCTNLWQVKGLFLQLRGHDFHHLIAKTKPPARAVSLSSAVSLPSNMNLRSLVQPLHPIIGPVQQRNAALHCRLCHLLPCRTAGTGHQHIEKPQVFPEKSHTLHFYKERQSKQCNIKASHF